MQRALSSELKSGSLTALCRSLSSSAAAPKFEEAITGALQQLWVHRAQHTNADGAVDTLTTDNISEASSRARNLTVPAGSRAIHTSPAQADKEVVIPVIGTRDVCYEKAPACIDITAERRAARENHMTWEAYIKMQKEVEC